MGNIDCYLAKENFYFRYRTGAIIIRDRKMLFVKNALGGYYYMIGGAVHLGETSRDCIEREVFEETGVHCKAVRSAIICENFFSGDRLDERICDKFCHVLEFYYLMATKYAACSIPSIFGRTAGNALSGIRSAVFDTKTAEGSALLSAAVKPAFRSYRKRERGRI